MRKFVRRALDSLAYRISVRLRGLEEEGRQRSAPDASMALLQQIAMMQGVYHQMGRAPVERLQLLAGRAAALAVQQRLHIRDLSDVEFRVFSQFGEDGIIEWLVSRLPEIPRSFVEFGVENYVESNTRFLLQNRGWKGLVFDGSEAHMATLRADELYWRHDITGVPAFITAENIDGLISSNGFVGELGILSVDIDGNDYWVYEAIRCVDPWIVIMEINGVFGDTKSFTVPYAPDFSRLNAHYSGQYFGCSIAAARRICEQRGYVYLGSSTSGVNAFFLRKNLAPQVLPAIECVKTWAARHRDSRTAAGELDFVRGLGRYNLIADMPVVDLESGRTVPIRELGQLYSDAFLRDFR
ncbi:MAG: hypothetical protein ACT4OF_06935 [Caulobacteraceae bacterium]